MKKRNCLILMLILVFQINAQKSTKYVDMNSIYYDVNQGIIDKKVLLFDGVRLEFDSTKPREFYLYSSIDSNKFLKKPMILNANKISMQKLRETNPNLPNDTSFVIVRVDPISGEPMTYPKKRLKEYYNVWKDEFFKGKKVVRYVDRDSICMFIYVDKILGDEINIGVYTKFKDHKVEFMVKDFGKVRTKKNPTIDGLYVWSSLNKIHPIYNWNKLYKIKKFKKKMSSFSVDFMDFILNEGDYFEKAYDQLTNYYWLNFNF